MDRLKDIGITRGYRRDDSMVRQAIGQSRNYYLQYYRADGGMKAAEEQQYSMIMEELFGWTAVVPCLTSFGTACAGRCRVMRCIAQ